MSHPIRGLEGRACSLRALYAAERRKDMPPALMSLAPPPRDAVATPHPCTCLWLAASISCARPTRAHSRMHQL